MLETVRRGCCKGAANLFCGIVFIDMLVLCAKASRLLDLEVTSLQRVMLRVMDAVESDTRNICEKYLDPPRPTPAHPVLSLGSRSEFCTLTTWWAIR